MVFEYICTWLLKLLQGVVNPRLRNEIDDYFRQSDIQKKQIAVLKGDIADQDKAIAGLTAQRVVNDQLLAETLQEVKATEEKLDAILNENPKPRGDDPLHDLGRRL
jgi:septal ring factor EnvC (AmiA/AmiB activator)